MANRAQEAAAALLKVFAMFKFTPQQVIKIGSLAHLVEMFGVSKEAVPDGLQYLLENELLVREGEHDWYLTELGCEKMHERGCEPTPVDAPARKEWPPVNKDPPDLITVSDMVFDRYGTLGYDQLSLPEKVFVCVWGLDGQVNNGGFDQYYFNSSGDHALDAVGSLEAIGAKDTANLVRQANALFGQAGPSPDRDERWKQLGAVGDAKTKTMNEIEEEFFKDEDDLWQLLEVYVSKNAEALRLK